MNGKLECSFRKFEVYQGSKKASKKNINYWLVAFLPFQLKLNYHLSGQS
jgi:hypothetical protein